MAHLAEALPIAILIVPASTININNNGMVPILILSLMATMFYTKPIKV